MSDFINLTALEFPLYGKNKGNILDDLILNQTSLLFGVISRQCNIYANQVQCESSAVIPFLPKKEGLEKSAYNTKCSFVPSA